MAKAMPGDDVRLRPAKSGDAEHLHELLVANREHLGEFLPWTRSLRTPTDTMRWVAPRVDATEYDGDLIYLIEFERSVVGVMSAEFVDRKNEGCEVGYWISKEYEGRGIVTRACSGFFDILFDEHDQSRIEVTMVPKNRRSRAVAERLGMIEEELRLRPPDAEPPGPTHMVVYSITKVLWDQSGARGNEPA